MIGILPAAGKAERMHGLPKFLLPIPGGYLLKRHVEMMDLVEGHKGTRIGANPDNEDFIRDYAGNASVYRVTSYATMSETVLSIGEYGRKSENNVLFGMPDTYIEDDQCYVRLAHGLEMGADVALMTFHTRPEQHRKVGMCRIDGSQVVEVVDKPITTELVYAWGAMAWKPKFWEFIEPNDPHVGYALPRAIDAGLDVLAVHTLGDYWDCGTPDEYFDLITHLHTEKV